MKPEIKREGFALLRETARREKAKRNTQNTFLVAMRLGETPVHIPNTKVKP